MNQLGLGFVGMLTGIALLVIGSTLRGMRMTVVEEKKKEVKTDAEKKPDKVKKPNRWPGFD